MFYLSLSPVSSTTLDLKVKGVIGDAPLSENLFAIELVVGSISTTRRSTWLAVDEILLKGHAVETHRARRTGLTHGPGTLAANQVALVKHVRVAHASHAK